MKLRKTPVFVLAMLCAAGALLGEPRFGAAEEMSADDKLRLLYSQRFVFTHKGLPLLTVGLMTGQSQVKLFSAKGLVVLPEGDNGPRVVAGRSWRVTVEKSRPAKMSYWTVVARLDQSSPGAASELAQWRKRGYKTKTFEVGVVFGIKGDVIDNREVFLGVSPQKTVAAAERGARAIKTKWNVETMVHPEMLSRPRGVLVARDETGVEVRNAGILWFSPKRKDSTITVRDVAYGLGGSQLVEKHETRQYFGQVFVVLGLDGKLTAVNAVPEDRLLAGLVPAEMYSDAPMEALKAQAVAARTELLAKIGTRHFAEPYLVCSSQHCQVYGGLGRETARTTKAVNSTRGRLLLRQGGGGLVDARYSAACGGFSEHNENIWDIPPDPALRGRLDVASTRVGRFSSFRSGINEKNINAFVSSPFKEAFCGSTRYSRSRHRWEVRIGKAALDTKVRKKYRAIGRVRTLRAVARGISGRIKTLEIVGDRGRVTVYGELVIRRLFGGLRSSLFVVKLNQAAGQWVFRGAGFGHGVGMCQTGAIGMAKAGHSFKRILSHYYLGSETRQLY